MLVFSDGAYLALVAVAEGEEDRRAFKWISLAQATFEVALVAPVKQTEIAAINHKPWRTSIGLNHVTKTWMSIFETCWWMHANSFVENFVEVGSFEFGVTGAVDLGSELENFGGIFTSDGASENNWRIWDEFEIVFELVEDLVSVLMLEIGLSDDENDALPGVDNLAGESLIKLRMWLGAIN